MKKDDIRRAKFEKGQSVRVIGPEVVTVEKMSDMGWPPAMNKMAGKIRNIAFVAFNPRYSQYHYSLETEHGEISWSYSENWLEAVK